MNKKNGADPAVIPTANPFGCPDYHVIGSPEGLLEFTHPIKVLSRYLDPSYLVLWFKQASLTREKHRLFLNPTKQDCMTV